MPKSGLTIGGTREPLPGGNWVVSLNDELLLINVGGWEYGGGGWGYGRIPSLHVHPKPGQRIHPGLCGLLLHVT
jgi:hypothetical protein